MWQLPKHTYGEVIYYQIIAEYELPDRIPNVAKDIIHSKTHEKLGNASDLGNV